MDTRLKQLLRAQSAEVLSEIIEGLYGISDDVDRRLESRLLAADPAALAQHLKKRIQSLKRGSRFIRYGESFEFGRELDALIKDIEGLVTTEPKAGFMIVELFMATHEKVLNRVDDSAGCVGDAYRDGVALWVKAAAAWRQRDGDSGIDWLDVVERHQRGNDYGIWDPLLPLCRSLLSEVELRELASRFEADALREARDKPGAFGYPAIVAAVGMAGVAEALGDVALYERATLIHAPDPNEMQREAIATFCLRVKDGEAALKWLDGPWDNHQEPSRQRLMDEALVLLDHRGELMALRRERYDAAPSQDALAALLEVAPDDERQLILAQAVDKARSAPTLSLAIDALLALEAWDEARERLLGDASGLSSVMYPTLIRWAEAFERGGQPLASALCYRALLEDILDEGRTRAYGHAARYYRALGKLDAGIDDYHGRVDHQAYEAWLREQHGRKRSFWQRLA